MKKIDLSFTNSFFDRFFASDNIVRPRRDWIILIVFFIVIILASLTFDAFMYEKISSGQMYVSVSRNELTVQNLNTTALENVVNDFESKTTEISTLKVTPAVDPSL